MDESNFNTSAQDRRKQSKGVREDEKLKEKKVKMKMKAVNLSLLNPGT